VGEFRKNTTWEDGVVRKRLLKKGHHFPEAMTKRRSSVYSEEKNRVTPLVAAPCDTNPSDVTAICKFIEAR